MILTAKRKVVSRHAMELLVAIGARGIKMMSYCLSRTVVVMNSASKEKKLRPWRVIVKLFNYKHYFCCSRLSSICHWPTDCIGMREDSTMHLQLSRGMRKIVRDKEELRDSYL